MGEGDGWRPGGQIERYRLGALLGKGGVFVRTRPGSETRSSGQADVALSADGSCAAAIVGRFAQVFDVRGDPAPLGAELLWKELLHDVEWSEERAVAVDGGTSLTWTRSNGWTEARDLGGWRLAFDGPRRIDALFGPKRSGRDVVDIAVAGRTLLPRVKCSALAARAGRVAIACALDPGATPTQLLVLALAPPTPTTPPRRKGPLDDVTELERVTLVMRDGVVHARP